MESTAYPKYLGVTMDRILSYNDHIQNTKINVVTLDNLLKILANSKWGTRASTIRTTALAVCNSIADYAAPIWLRSTYTYTHSDINYTKQRSHRPFSNSLQTASKHTKHTLRSETKPKHNANSKLLFHKAAFYHLYYSTY